MVFNFILIFGVTALITASISLGFYSYYDGLVRSSIRDSNDSALRKIKDVVDMIVIDVDRLSLRICNDTQINDFLKYNMSADMNYGTAEKINSIKKILALSNFTGDYIASVDIYSIRNDYIISSLKDSGRRAAVYGMPDADFIRPEDVWTAPTMPLGVDNRTRYITNYRKIPLHGSEKTGIVMISLDIEKLGLLLKDASSKNYEEVYIINKDNIILYSTNYSFVGEKVDDVQSLRDTGGFNGKELFSTIVESEYNNWNYVSLVVPREYNGNKSAHLQQVLILSLLLSMIIALAGSLWIATRVFQPIGILMDIVQDKTEEKINLLTPVSGASNELQHIIECILDIYKKQYEMGQELSKRKMLLEKAQIIALQSQINPHFIHNTLETINWRAYELTGEQNEVMEMIGLLSKLMRNCLETQDNIILIRDEVEHSKIYVEILMRRHDNAFSVSWNIDEKILSCKIVKLSLQPIIENAIYHGVIKSVTKGSIEINGYIFEEYVVVDVINDGIPIDDKIIKDLNEDMQSEQIKEDSQIGLRNVNQRIKLSLGEKYGISVSKDEKQNTVVKILLPKY